MHLMDPEKEIRLDEIEAAIDSVKHNPDVVPFLIEVLKTTNDRFLINKISLTLGDIGDERAVKPLVDLLSIKPAVPTKGNLLSALAQFDYLPYVDLLVDLLINGHYEVSIKSNIMLDNVKERIPEEKKVELIKKIRAKIEENILQNEAFEEVICFLTNN